MLGFRSIPTDVPACHCIHATVAQSVSEISISVLQCFIKLTICPSPCMIFQGMNPAPAYAFDA